MAMTSTQAPTGYPAFPPSLTPPPPPPGGGKRRSVAGIAAVAVVAAVVGGGVGGYVGHQTATGPAAVSSTGTLQQPVPAAGDQPAGAISAVAQRVLPSVVQLSGTSGEGSGVVLSTDGLILTNAHVLEAGRAGQLTANFQDGTSAPVSVVGTDARADLAVVRAQGVSGLTPIQLGNSDGLQVGQQVVAVGSPLGLAGTVTSGIVSSLNRPVETSGGGGGEGGLGGPAARPAPRTSVLDAIQTDAAINPGNSGGPLVDMQGRIVGINSAIASLGAGSGGLSGSIGLGFSIPINQAKRIADELVATGHATRAALGVTVRDAAPKGAQLVDVTGDGAAARAGLRPGDVVSRIGDRVVQDSDELVAAVNSASPGSTVALTVSSGGAAPRPVAVTLGSVPADQG
jgi:putative serine protease PepD